ncbi:Hypothetical predicted protein [Octopus vulgaris]|uniref:RNA-directed DNA polymerase from mobile element jockey n=1 Tax=Octopus vulgaris TaxID=6645 RepID=A0AA36FDK6_OCTVU|nr:Hypothetical predicted protein [Octopus vulgaris]
MDICQLPYSLCNHYWVVIRDAKPDYEQHIHDRRISSQRVGSRDFWRIIKSVRGNNKSSIPPLFNGPEVLTTSNDKAELFAQLFSSHSILDGSGHPLLNALLKTDKLSRSSHITSAKFAAIMAQLDPSKATGPDGIPVTALQKCSPGLSSVLSRLFRKCISESCFPSLWKFSTVVLVFINSGDRYNPRNYGPISLLLIISKVFESLINDSLVKYLDSNCLFSDSSIRFPCRTVYC